MVLPLRVAQGPIRVNPLARKRVPVGAEVARRVEDEEEAQARDLAAIVRSELRKRTPVKTGRLRDSLRVRIRNGSIVTVEYLARYAAAVHEFYRRERKKDWIEEGIDAAVARGPSRQPRPIVIKLGGFLER